MLAILTRLQKQQDSEIQQLMNHHKSLKIFEAVSVTILLLLRVCVLHNKNIIKSLLLCVLRVVCVVIMPVCYGEFHVYFSSVCLYVNFGENLLMRKMEVVGKFIS